MNQYHMRVTAVYEFFVDAESEDDAFEEAEFNYLMHTQGIPEELWPDILSTYPSPNV
jgi:hypothetical protein